MTQAVRTKSQVLFERFCTQHGLGCTAIPVEHTRTADYRVIVQGHEIVAEVKQLDPNAQDRASSRALKSGGIGKYGGEAGSRIRHMIDKGKEQVANLARDRSPGLLVIYNNVPECPTYTDPMFVMIAMYGHLTLELELSSSVAGPPKAKALRHGAKNKMSPCSNTSLSAVCVLQERDDGQLLLTCYHNRFAAIPFDAEWLRVPEVRHFGHPPGSGRFVKEWTEL